MTCKHYNTKITVTTFKNKRSQPRELYRRHICKTCGEKFSTREIMDTEYQALKNMRKIKQRLEATLKLL